VLLVQRVMLLEVVLLRIFMVVQVIRFPLWLINPRMPWVLLPQLQPFRVGIKWMFVMCKSYHHI
jgi:hypothetical protein